MKTYVMVCQGQPITGIILTKVLMCIVHDIDRADRKVIGLTSKKNVAAVPFLPSYFLLIWLAHQRPLRNLVIKTQGNITGFGQTKR
ncbi:MAG: hypothetical protein ACI8Z9_002663 [Paraglaciecola sp.]|jgi:hypothetical protein